MSDRTKITLGAATRLLKAYLPLEVGRAELAPAWVAWPAQEGSNGGL